MIWGWREARRVLPFVPSPPDLGSYRSESPGRVGTEETLLFSPLVLDEDREDRERSDLLASPHRGLLTASNPVPCLSVWYSTQCPGQRSIFCLYSQVNTWSNVSSTSQFPCLFPSSWDTVAFEPLIPTKHSRGSGSDRSAE